MQQPLYRDLGSPSAHNSEVLKRRPTLEPHLAHVLGQHQPLHIRHHLREQRQRIVELPQSNNRSRVWQTGIDIIVENDGVGSEVDEEGVVQSGPAGERDAGAEAREYLAERDAGDEAGEEEGWDSVGGQFGEGVDGAGGELVCGDGVDAELEFLGELGHALECCCLVGCGDDG